ncbi:unnamed protein product [Gongylonema pulchrum]|uniref:Cation-transporting P-type ATPase N-terminal domain-containing protein n=1 Tax=Gongylonema pulchrum TaxID=637853 RepID=A0A3P6T0L7_9BILA|nr:unnamed protein product [Gongylonema pulchrum]
MCTKLKTDPINGLPNEKSLLEARRRIFGRNEIPAVPSKSFLRLAWEALQSVNRLAFAAAIRRFLLDELSLRKKMVRFVILALMVH